MCFPRRVSPSHVDGGKGEPVLWCHGSGPRPAFYQNRQSPYNSKIFGELLGFQSLIFSQTSFTRRVFSERLADQANQHDPQVPPQCLSAGPPSPWSRAAQCRGPSSQANYPKRKFPSERSQARSPKRKIPCESSQGYQAKGPKRKSPSEEFTVLSTTTKDPKRCLFRGLF